MKSYLHNKKENDFSRCLIRNYVRKEWGEIVLSVERKNKKAKPEDSRPWKLLFKNAGQKWSTSTYKTIAKSENK